MNIEHRIVIGMISSTEYLQQITPLWNPRFLEGPASKLISIWVLDHFEKYNKAPGKDIWRIYFAKRETIDEDMAQDIGEDILPGLAELNEEQEFNLQYLLDQTFEFINERNLKIFADDIYGHLQTGNVLEAEKLASEFKPVAKDLGHDIDFKDEKALEKIDKAFDNTSDILIDYPFQLKDYWSHDLRRGAFVSLMSIEKRGKTFWLLDMAVRAARQYKKVAFFQAGDMTEDEQIMRTCIHITRRSNRAEFTGKMWEPVRDCVYNQLGTCEKPERQCDIGAMNAFTETQIRREIVADQIHEARMDNPGYEPCHNCNEYWSKKGYGAVWLERVNVGDPLEINEAKKIWRETFTDKLSLRLSTHINGTLTVKNIRGILDIWEKQHNFVPDVIIIDYADLLTTEEKIDYRHQQNLIWRALRGLSEERHCLVVTATQADADAYKRDRLTLLNFSEDKRKFSHVTAMWGLNQDKHGREKSLGIMRINELVKRDAPFHESNEITILQNLRRGQPYLSCYYS